LAQKGPRDAEGNNKENVMPSHTRAERKRHNGSHGMRGGMAAQMKGSIGVMPGEARRGPSVGNRNMLVKGAMKPQTSEKKVRLENG